ncbi:MAG: flavodoxin-dependent (E)-4-hydroxy-3-methylbut-2-enyl-diphosphate synthase [Clostridia bacterium]|nr:flavodoxin-dependent (E)-4-hydroxy-3-methylbut-2-enyl-diphosphate synthase [Clostridia bacterium]
MEDRKLKREMSIGGVKIGGKNKIAVQSMTNTDTRDVKATAAQIKRLEEAGCDIVRCAVPDAEAAEAMGRIREEVKIPLVADIHFDYRLAIRCMELGINKIRINPGNIGSRSRVREVVECAACYGVPIRIGVNGGSLERDLIEKYKRPTAEALVESAFRHVEILEDLNFHNTVVSIKVSDVPEMMKAYRIFHNMSDIPLHVGVTEAGTERMGIIKSAVGIGGLLSEGIGDTIRVSLTADPVAEVYAARDILAALGLADGGVKFVSCPTCGRTQIDLISIAREVEERLKGVDKNIKVAVMGCAVNGPGEARDADVGIAGGKGSGLIFTRGQILRKVPEDRLVDELFKEIEKL